MQVNKQNALMAKQLVTLNKKLEEVKERLKMLKLISPTFEDIKTWYQLKEYSKEDIAWYVDMEVIDKEEYAIITGEKYPENLES